MSNFHSWVNYRNDDGQIWPYIPMKEKKSLNYDYLNDLGFTFQEIVGILQRIESEIIIKYESFLVKESSEK